MSSWQTDLVNVMNEAIAHGGGTIIVKNSARRELTESALLQLAPATARKITVTVDFTASKSYFTPKK